MATIEITRDEYMNVENGWAQYRSVSTRESAEWMAERLPSEAESEFAIVNRGTYYTIARRFISCHLWETPSES